VLKAVPGRGATLSTMSKSVDDRKRERELEEARKAGTVPAERDAEGNEINPHIPQFMSQAPWYLNAEGPGLQHQRNLKQHQKVAGVTDFIPKGQRAGPAATVFRKGACTNCGAMTHKAKDCVERPRKKGAKFSGSDIKADEVVFEMSYDYAGKRDHWAQYDPSEHMRKIEAYDKEMEIRLQQHKQESMAKLAAKEADRAAAEKEKKRKRKRKGGGEGEGEDGEDRDSDTDGDTDGDTDDEDNDEEKLDESEQVNVGTKMNANRNGGAKMSVRNLRIREDTAKYLLNLDVDSAYYDPKTRSMRENPLADGKEVGPSGTQVIPYNIMKQTGDARELAALQLYEIEAYNKGQNLHLNADPTSLELTNKIFRERKASLKDEKVNKVLDKYGGAQHLEKPPAELLFAQTEEYTEYTRSGALVAGKEKAVVRSKYEEDVHTHNHSCVWGSFFDRQTFRWGYEDDHGTIRNAYGTGEAGKRARILSKARMEASLEAPPPAAAAAAGGVGSSGSTLTQAELFGTGEGLGDAALDEAKLKEAMSKERERSRRAEEEADDRRRKYNSMTSTETTAEEMEAYHRIKARADDPMAAMLAAGDDAATDDEA